MVEKFLQVRGILKTPDAFTEQKDKQSFKLVNQSSYLNEANFDQEVTDELN